MDLVQLIKIFPETKYEILEKYVQPLEKTMERYDIDTLSRKSCFISQIGHESGGFKSTSENLNYSAQRLVEVFPKYFRNRNPHEYHRAPEKIANVVYASRMGNGPEESGDGWRFRGRGLIQLTGKTNYLKFAAAMKLSVADTILYLETPFGACMSAGWFWSENNLNSIADKEDIRTLTVKINGGLNGFEHRLKLFTTCKKILA